MDTADDGQDSRIGELRDWLNGLGGFDLSTLRPASGDASFRRYFRLNRGDRSFVVMDAPPTKEDCGPYLRIAGYLEQMGLHAPHVIETSIEQGFLLLTDLGSRQYLSELQDAPGRATELYGDALRALTILQSEGQELKRLLPPYDDKLLRFELSLFRDWLCKRHLGIDFGPDDELEWQRCCDLLADNALSQPSVFVHRDYHSRNLMLVDDNNPGILDFQDAVEGPLTYDLVSLLKDCYISWPAERVRGWAEGFHRMAPSACGLGLQEFMRAFELTGVQRQLKASGIFARLNHRDGKPAYLRDVPRTLNYIIDIAPRYPELTFVARLIATRVLPQLNESRG
ncbi:MAG: phosphotransferase [Woeseiaceae bacterium]|nr:phosphotransferase [Woeseiaceae bacterium]